jgi:Protein of unknown function (DUF3038)
MRPIAKMPDSPPQWQELAIVTPPNGELLDSIKAHLDLLLLALESLTGVTSDGIIQAAKDLQLEAAIGNRIQLWRLRQSNPLRKSSGGRKKLDIEEARAMVLIICHLAKQYQDSIRCACVVLEEMMEQRKKPHLAAILGDYLDRFYNAYQERIQEDKMFTGEKLENLACKLLIDILFYSASNGHRRLWLALLDYSR